MERDLIIGKVGSSEGQKAEEVVEITKRDIKTNVRAITTVRRIDFCLVTHSFPSG